MRRRTVLAAIALGASRTLLPAHAQGRVEVGCLSYGDQSDNNLSAFLSGLRRLGWREEANLTLVLPGLSILLIAVAFGLAALSGAGPDGRPSVSRYVSAALAFIGFGAALMTDPEPMLSLLEGSRRTP